MKRNIEYTKDRAQSSKTSSRGQALVEMALLLPILLLLFAGLIELGFGFYNYLVVVNAAREGARYGAKMPEFPDEQVAYAATLAGQNLPEFVQVDEQGEPLIDEEGRMIVNDQRASVFVSRVSAPVPEDGYDYEYAILDGYPKAFGKAALAEEDQESPKHYSQVTEPRLAGIADEVEAALSGITFQQDADFIIVEVFYDHSQVIRLFKIGEIIPDPIPLSSLTMMRVVASARQAGCPVCPIALHIGTVEGVAPGESLGDIMNGTGPGQFGWLTWPEDKSGDANYLAAALANCYLSMRDYDNPYDTDDHHLDLEDYIWGNTGVSGSDEVREILDAYIAGQDVIRVAVWDQVADEGGSDIRFKLAGFARVRIDDYDLDHDTITATFLGMDPLCADM